MSTADELLRKFNNVKTIPHVAIQLTRLISDPDSSMRDFESIIKMDPTLVLRLLKVVNSTYYGLRKKVDSISRAVVIIGTNNLRNMIATEALKDIFKAGSEEACFSRKRLWLHSAAVAVCGQMIAERIFSQNAEDVFLCGILHDIGMIVEDQTANTDFMAAVNAYTPGGEPITAFETAYVGTDHCMVGHLVARDWKLPPDVQEGIKNHHGLFEEITPSSMTGIIQMAEYLTAKMDFKALPDMQLRLSSPLVAHMRENIDEYKVLIKDLPTAMSSAKELYEMSEESA